MRLSNNNRDAVVSVKWKSASPDAPIGLDVLLYNVPNDNAVPGNAGAVFEIQFTWKL